MGVLVLPGVKIGNNSIIGAGSVEMCIRDRSSMYREFETRKREENCNLMNKEAQ